MNDQKDESVDFELQMTIRVRVTDEVLLAATGTSFTAVVEEIEGQFIETGRGMAFLSAREQVAHLVSEALWTITEGQNGVKLSTEISGL